MRYVGLFLILMLSITACRDKIICPAFQSTYILDDSTRMAFYSYAWQLDEATRESYISSLSQTPSDSLDSTSSASGELQWSDYYAYAGDYKRKAPEVRKSKFGIVKYEPYWLKNYNMKRAPMENVLGPKKEIPAIEEADSPEVQIAQSNALDSMAVVANDSTMAGAGLDSTAVASAQEEVPTKKKEQRYRFRYDPKDNFNADQDYYNKYFGVLLLDLTPEPEPDTTSAAVPGETAIPDSLAADGGGLKGKLKGLFGKKKKAAEETSEPEETTDTPQGEPAEEGNGN